MWVNLINQGKKANGEGKKSNKIWSNFIIRIFLHASKYFDHNFQRRHPIELKLTAFERKFNVFKTFAKNSYGNSLGSSFLS